MNLARQRIVSLIRKELVLLFRDPKVRLVLIMPPLVQLFIFSFAATMEVKNIHVAVYNQDTGKHSHEFIQRVSAAPSFSRVFFVQSPELLARAIDEQKAIAGIIFLSDFSRGVEAGDGGRLQLILDGRRSNAAQIVSGYLAQMVQQYGVELSLSRGAATPAPAILHRNWFNPNLIYLWSTVPALTVILGMLITLMVTSLSVAREKELGTFDQLLVSPLSPGEILVGKAVPAILVGLGESLLIFCVGVTVFGVPITGSFWLLLLSLCIFIVSVVGSGLFISALVSTQQQAILGAFIFMVPAVTLSGFAAPVENMPLWLQKAVQMNPLQHALILVKGLYVKEMPLAEVWQNTWPLLLIGLGSLWLAGRFFARKVG